MNKVNIKKALSPAYRKHKPLRKEVNSFIMELQECLDTIKLIDEKNESEEHLKEPIKIFLKNTFYKDNLINTKDKIDLAIYLGKKADSNVGVLIEAKKPSNKSEFLSNSNLNKKALHELLLYYLRERVDGNNNNIKHLIATNGYEWFLFKAEDFYKYFYKNIALIKEYKDFRDGLKDTSKNELFYDEIAKKYISEVESSLPFVYIDFRNTRLDKLSDTKLNTFYKIFSDVNLLGHTFGNDSNQLNRTFYNELLHIIGLEEKKENGKKIIKRKPLKDRDYASILENAIFVLEERNYSNDEEVLFNAGLELSITWINRILFLKLLESQLLNFHKNVGDYKFLNIKFINGFDSLNNLFFSALAKKPEDRHVRLKEKYKNIPYLNSSLFDRTNLEKDTFEISALKDDELEVFSKTVLEDQNNKRLEGNLDTLDYLFRFLDAYDFAVDGDEGIQDGVRRKSLINASVLGLIFEKINGYKEGSFYTPGYITGFMCREAIERALVQKFRSEENQDIGSFEELKAYCSKFFKPTDTIRFNQIFNSLKICDPAVGSGHFLVSALNELIFIKYELGILQDDQGIPLKCEIQVENDELYILDSEANIFEYNPLSTESLKIQKSLFDEKLLLIENCLFGVDINPNSVKICRLRLWIELLKSAYYTPEGVLQTLPNIDINIKQGNSLISRFSLDDDLQMAFKKKEIQYNFSDYKKAVNDYKNSNSKDQKSEVLQIINEVKNNFTSNLDNEFIEKFQKARGKYTNEEERIRNLRKFGQKIKKSEKDNLRKLKENAEKAYLEKEEIINNEVFNNAFEWRFEFPEVLDESGKFVGFDLIIGNPPYMRIQEIAKTQIIEKSFYESNYTVARASYDLANLFFELAMRISNDQSNGSFIFPHKFLNSASTECFREYLLQGKFVDKITHFGANMIFGEADTYTCIMNFSSSKNDGFNIYKAKFKDNYAERMWDSSNYEFINYKQLNELSILYGTNQWIMPETPLGIELFKKLYRNTEKIEDVFEKIFQGIATGKDSLYILQGETNGEYIEGNFKDSEFLRLEKGIMKPFVKGKVVHRYASLPSNSFIFFPYTISDKGKATVMKEDFIQENFPNAYKWLKGIESEHRKKDSRSTDDEYWYRYARNQGISNVEQKKLSSMEICSSFPNVTINRDYYHPTTVYSWVKKESVQESYEYLLAIANSKIMWWFLMVTGDTLQGDARRLKTNYLNPFPMPFKPSQNIQLSIENLVKSIMHSKKNQLDQEAKLLEKDLEKMVYELYDLNSEEIKIIESV